MHARKLPRISEPSFDRDYYHGGGGGGGSGGPSASSGLSGSHAHLASASSGTSGGGGYERGGGGGSAHRHHPHASSHHHAHHRGGGGGGRYHKSNKLKYGGYGDHRDRDRDRDRDRGGERDRGDRERSLGGRRSISPDTPNRRGGGEHHRSSSKHSRGGHKDRDYYGGGSSSKYRGGSKDDRSGGDYSSSSSLARDRSPLSGSSGLGGGGGAKDRKWGENANKSSSALSRSGLDKDGASSVATGSALESKVKSVCDWSEHVSSTGKKYYFNFITEVSQWKKPAEWLEYERGRNAAATAGSSETGPSTPLNVTLSGGRNCDSNHHYSSSKHHASSTSSSTGNAVASAGHTPTPGSSGAIHSSRLTHRDSSTDREYSGSAGAGRGTYENANDHRRSSAKISGANAVPQGYSENRETRSRDGTPTWEHEDNGHGQNHHYPNSLSAALPPMASHASGSGMSGGEYRSNNYHSATPNNASSGSSSAGASLSTQDALKTLQSALMMNSSSNVHHHHSQPQSNHHHQQQQQQQQQQSQHLHHNNHHHHHHYQPPPSQSQGHHNNLHSPLTSSPGLGPPTPTHSELDSSSQHPSSLPAGSGNSLSNNHHASSGSSSSIGVSSLTALNAQVPSLTPSLAKLYKDSLIEHVVGWAAESVERACQRVNEEHNNISNLGITKVSAELKMARSLVRLAEIQATLQEQRILFLRQQSIDLDNMKTRSSASVSSYSSYLPQPASSSISTLVHHSAHPDHGGSAPSESSNHNHSSHHHSHAPHHSHHLNQSSFSQSSALPVSTSHHLHPFSAAGALHSSSHLTTTMATVGGGGTSTGHGPPTHSSIGART